MRKLTLSGVILFVALTLTFNLSSCSGGGGDGGGSSTDTTATAPAQFDSSEVANRAIADLGGEAQAAVAILMSLAKDNTLPRIVAAINAGSLGANGDINARSLARLADICQNPDDETLCRQELQGEVDGWLASSGLTEEEQQIVFLTLQMADLGYSPAQITSYFDDFVTFGGQVASFGSIDGIRNCAGFDSNGDCNSWETVEPAECMWNIFFGTDENFNNRLCSDTQSEGGTGSGEGGTGGGTDTGDGGGTSDTPSTAGMTFPTFYKGAGSYFETYTNPNTGSIDCSSGNVVYVARAGGIGFNFGLVKVFVIDMPHRFYDNTSLTCRNFSDFVATGAHNGNGVYEEVFNTSTYTADVSVFFNRDRLWGFHVGTETIEVLNGQQVTTKNWSFDLNVSTEEEYNAATGQ